MGEIVTYPKYIVLNQPKTRKVNKDHVELYWDTQGPYATIHYAIMSNIETTLAEHFIKVQGADFTAYMKVIGTIIKNRSEALIAADIESKYGIEDV